MKLLQFKPPEILNPVKYKHAIQHVLKHTGIKEIYLFNCKIVYYNCIVHSCRVSSFLKNHENKELSFSFNIIILDEGPQTLERNITNKRQST